MTGKASKVSALFNQRPHAVANSTVLLVEDETLVRMDIADTFRDAGLVVIECASGDEALEVLHSGAKFDLLFTDVRMPGETDGVALAHRVRLRHPHIPIIFASAHLAPRIAERYGPLLRKPFATALALRLVQQAIGDGASDLEGAPA